MCWHQCICLETFDLYQQWSKSLKTQAAKTVLNYSIFKIAVDDKWLLKIDHLSLGTLASVGGRTERGWTRIWTLPGAKTVIWEGKGALRHPSPSFVFLMCFEKLCMCVCGIRTQFVICESKFGAGSNPPSYPVEPTPSEPHGAASLWEGQIAHRNVEVEKVKEVRGPASSGSCGNECRRAGVFGDEDLCVAQVPATSSSGPISVGAGGHDRFPYTTRGVKLVQPGTSQACQAILRFPSRAYSTSLHNQPTNSLNSTSPFIACQRTIALCTFWVHCHLDYLRYFIL